MGCERSMLSWQLSNTPLFRCHYVSATGWVACRSKVNFSQDLTVVVIWCHSGNNHIVTMKLMMGYLMMCMHHESTIGLDGFCQKYKICVYLNLLLPGKEEILHILSQWYSFCQTLEGVNDITKHIALQMLKIDGYISFNANISTLKRTKQSFVRNLK